MLKTKEEIIQWLEQYHITRYQINEDLTVDIMGSLNLKNKDLKEIPISFGIIHETAHLENNQLTQLPFIKEIKMSLFADNNELTSLEGLPKIGGTINVENNKITSLKGLPKKIYRNLKMANNQLTSLEYCSSYVIGFMDVSHNPLLSLEHLPKRVGGDFWCYSTPVNVLESNIIKSKIEGSILFDVKDDMEHKLEEFYIGKKLFALQNEDEDYFIKMSLLEIKDYHKKRKFVSKLEKVLKEQEIIIKPKI